MSDHKSPVDQALDLLLYAPLGSALESRTLLPKLIDRGRSQVTLARTMGEFAVGKGQKKVSKQLTQVQEQALTALAELGLVPGTGAGDGDAGNGQAPPAPGHTAGPGAPAPGTDGRAHLDLGRRADLAIPEFDSLAASQVIPRLEGLSPEELEAVRAYEAGRRGRKTILNKIAQLQG